MTRRTNAEQPCVGSPRQVADPPIPAVRLQYLVEQIHALGPYPLSHLLAEIIGGASPLPRIERYARLSRERGHFIRASGGDQFPPRIFIVNRNAPNDLS
jgi:hypothetical protein